MGNKTPTKKQTIMDRQSTKLQFYMQINDPQMGRVKIYTSRNRPLKFIMKYIQQSQDTQIYNTFMKVQDVQSSPLLQLYGFSVQRQQCCNKISRQCIISYWDYYNFYFNDYLNKRSKFQCTFMDSEVWHIVDAICQTYTTFKKFGIYYQINPKTFLVTPEGKLKTMWCHLKNHNKHLKYHQFFQKNCQAQPFYYSPQQIQCMFQKQKTFKINFDKCNSWRLGVLLLRCLTLSQPLHLFYNPSMSKINYGVIKNLINSQVIPNYPDQISNLLKSLLRLNPNQRPTPMEVYDAHTQYFNSQFQLKVCGKSQKQKKYLAQKISAGQHAKFYKSPKKPFLAPQSERLSQKTVKLQKGNTKN